jgi:hypothetical protein
LVAGRQEPLLDRYAVHQGAGGRFQIREEEAFILSSYLAVEAGNRRIVNANRVGGIPAYQQRWREAEFGFSEGTTER